VLIRLDVRPCLRRSGFAQAGRSLSDRVTHARKDRFLRNIRLDAAIFEEGRICGGGGEKEVALVSVVIVSTSYYSSFQNNRECRR